MRRAGVEGTGSYGASLSRYLLSQGVDVFDVNRRLTDCEGLGPRLMPYYNPILYVSGTAAVAALLLENDSARLRPEEWCMGSHLIRVFVPASE